MEVETSFALDGAGVPAREERKEEDGVLVPEVLEPAREEHFSGHSAEQWPSWPQYIQRLWSLRHCRSSTESGFRFRPWGRTAHSSIGPGWVPVAVVRGGGVGVVVVPEREVNTGGGLGLGFAARLA